MDKIHPIYGLIAKTAFAHLLQITLLYLMIGFGAYLAIAYNPQIDIYLLQREEENPDERCEQDD